MGLPEVERIVVNGLGYNVALAGAGPAIVLLHGFTGSLATWQLFIPVLAARYRVVAIDLPGHGATDAPDNPARYRMERVVDDLAAILDRLGIGRAVWFGYSMGGRVALHVAVARPECVAALILEGASPGIPDPDERTERIRSDQALAERIEREGIRAFVEHWERLPLFASQARLPESVRATLRQQRLANRPAGVANSLRGVGQGAQEALLDQLPNISARVLLIAGALDDKFRRSNATMAKRLPNAETRVIDGAGHAVHLERPDLSLAASLTFLESLERNEEEWRR